MAWLAKLLDRCEKAALHDDAGARGHAAKPAQHTEAERRAAEKLP